MSAIDNKYLKVFGGPFEECFCGISLKTSVILFAIVDIVYAVITIGRLIDGVRLLSDMIFLGLLVTTSSLLDIGLAIFGIFGIIGINTLNLNYLAAYSWAKTFYFFIRMIFNFIFFFVLFIYVNDAGFRLTIVIFFVFSTIYNLYSGKLVWSSLVRIENNETILVMHGKSTVLLLQSRNMDVGSAQVYALPGQPIDP